MDRKHQPPQVVNLAQSRQSKQQLQQTGQEMVYILWELMGEVFSDRWVMKNGSVPSSIWKMAVSKLSPAQLDSAVQACIDRCIKGNHWPPDLAEFLSIVGLGGGNPFGLTRNDVMLEFKRYCRDRDYYSSAEMFPWRQPVLYWICTELRQRMNDYRLSEVEVEKLAGLTLITWADRIAAGGEVPMPTLKLEDKQRTRPDWMNAYNERNDNAVNSKSAGQGEDISH